MDVETQSTLTLILETLAEITRIAAETDKKLATLAEQLGVELD
jgi:hypothetical protein